MHEAQEAYLYNVKASTPKEGTIFRSLLATPIN